VENTVETSGLAELTEILPRIYAFFSKAQAGSGEAKVPFPRFSGDIEWNQHLGPDPLRVETKVNRHSFSTWFKPTALSPTAAARLQFASRTPSSKTG